MAFECFSIQLFIPLNARALDGRTIDSITHNTMPINLSMWAITVSPYSFLSLNFPMFLFWDFHGSRGTTPLLTGPLVLSWVGACSATHIA
jgi:hypothetical protein